MINLSWSINICRNVVDTFMGQNEDNSLMDGEKEKDLLKYKFKEQLDSGRNRIQTQ